MPGLGSGVVALHGQSFTGLSARSTLCRVGMIRPDPLTASPELLAQELMRLQREFGFASHEFESGATPQGADAETIGWWRLALDCWQRAQRERLSQRR